EVSASGYMPARSSFKKLSEVEDDDGFDFGLLRASSVEGRVVTTGGKPVAGALIAAVYGRDLLIGTQTLLATSGADGRFVLDPVDARDITLFATHPRYQPVTTLLSAGDDGPREVEILMPAGRRITGTVRDK